jgi:hypothetical protein
MIRRAQHKLSLYNEDLVLFRIEEHEHLLKLDFAGLRSVHDLLRNLRKDHGMREDHCCDVVRISQVGTRRDTDLGFHVPVLTRLAC